MRFELALHITGESAAITMSSSRYQHSVCVVFLFYFILYCAGSLCAWCITHLYWPMPKKYSTFRSTRIRVPLVSFAWLVSYIQSATLYITRYTFPVITTFWASTMKPTIIFSWPVQLSYYLLFCTRLCSVAEKVMLMIFLFLTYMTFLVVIVGDSLTQPSNISYLNPLWVIFGRDSCPFF